MAVQQYLMMGTQASGRTIISGELWTWGSNLAATPILGQNDTTARYNNPTQVGSLTNWRNDISGSYLGIGTVKTDGTLWTWGSGQGGQLGLGDTTIRSSPVQVGSLTDWKEVSMHMGYCHAIKTDGTLWGWGNNFHDSVGDGTSTNRSSPVQIGSLTDWLHVVHIDGGAAIYGGLAVKTDGTLWWWGTDTPQSGYGNDNNSPTQVGSASDWTDIIGFGNQHDHSIFAIKEA